MEVGIEKRLAEEAELILGNFELNDDEINLLIKEWSSYEFEIGRWERCLAKLQRLAFEYVTWREGYWPEYRASRKEPSERVGYLLRE